MRIQALAGILSVLMLLTGSAGIGPSAQVRDTPVQPRLDRAPGSQTEMRDWPRYLIEPTGIDESIQMGGFEPTVLANPNNPDNVVVGRGSSLRISTDGGETWIPALDQNPIAFPLPPGGGGTTFGRSGDPSLAFDSQGRLFWSTLITITDGGGGGRDVWVAQYNPMTGALIDTANVTASAGVPGANGGPNHDKEWMAADHWNSSPFRDRLYMVWSPLITANFQMYAAYSTDQGENWTMSNPFPLSLNAEGLTWPPHITVAPDGDVYIAYHSQPGFEGNPTGRLPDGTTGQITVLRSTDGGVTYSQRSTAFDPGESDITWNVQSVTPNAKTVPNTQFWLQGASQPWILADPFTDGRIYVVSNDDPDDTHGSGDEGNVYMVISDDDGLTWSDPHRIDTGPGISLQTMPTASIDPITGCIAVHYFDTRNGATNTGGNLLLDVYATTSSDGGVTFVPDFKISDIPFDPDPGAGNRFAGPPPTTRIGEYNGVSLAHGRAYAVWTGNSFTGSVATGQQTIFDKMSPPLGFLPDTLSAEFQPPDPWGQEGVVIDTISLVAEVDLENLTFYSEPLQCFDVPCEVDHVKKIHHDNIEFVPPVVANVAAGDTVSVEVKRTVPIGQAAGIYYGRVHATASTSIPCFSEVADDFVLCLEVKPLVDMDIADNGGNLSNDTMYLVGAKGDFVQGTFVIVNPNSWDQNVDFEDGPGNIKIQYEDHYFTGLIKVGDDFVNISDAVNFTTFPAELSSGEAAEVSVQINIPDGIPVNATYRTRVVVTYESCLGGSSVLDAFNVELLVLPTQGALNIVQTEISDSFCPDDPWISEGQVFLSFDVQAIGDHRNIRVASGGLRHESLDQKLDLFNFYPEEIAFLASGETRTINVITKIPIGQHSGEYAEYFRVVSENGGEDSVLATIDICEIYDLDVRDDYANVSGNVMTIQALSRGNQSGGEYRLRSFEVGLPSNQTVNDDYYDGPGNTAIDCVECEFAEWSPMWHESDPSHNFYSNFLFTGYGTVLGDSCGTWESGEFRRMLVSLFVPPMTMSNNHPGTYKGRLTCYGINSAGPDTVSQDHFDIEIHLARIVGPSYEIPKDEPAFIAVPTPLGAELSWGDFREVGLNGQVNVYRQDPGSGTYVRLNGSPLPQRSSYRDEGIVPGDRYSYKLGIQTRDREILLGPVSVGGTPRVFSLAQNAPNPFQDQTTISYDLAREGAVSLKVFDVNGRMIRVLKNGYEPAGVYSLTWDRRDDAGRRQSSGIYFYRLEAPGFSATRKMVVLR